LLDSKETSVKLASFEKKIHAHNLYTEGTSREFTGKEKDIFLREQALKRADLEKELHELKLAQNEISAKKASLENGINDIKGEISNIVKALDSFGVNPIDSMGIVRQKLSTKENVAFIQKITRWDNISNFLNDVKEMGSFEIGAMQLDIKDRQYEKFKSLTVFDFLDLIKKGPEYKRLIDQDTIEMLTLNEKTHFINTISEFFETRILDFPSMIGDLISRFRKRIENIHQIGPIREKPKRYQEIDLDKNITQCWVCW